MTLYGRYSMCQCDHETRMHGFCQAHGKAPLPGLGCNCPTVAHRWTEALESLSEQVYRTADEHGFHDTLNPLPQSLCMIHSEISEALEAYRDDEPPLRYDINGKPEGVVVELADALIRILDTAHELAPGVLAEAVLAKMAYNNTRPVGHGRARL